MAAVDSTPPTFEWYISALTKEAQKVSPSLAQKIQAIGTSEIDRRSLRKYLISS